jgi:hypothetical protein
MGIFAKPRQAQTGSLRFKGGDIRSTPLNSIGGSNILSQLKQPIFVIV